MAVEKIHENEQGMIFRIDQRRQGIYHTSIYIEKRDKNIACLCICVHALKHMCAPRNRGQKRVLDTLEPELQAVGQLAQEL